MPAYLRSSVADFIQRDSEFIQGKLHTGYSHDGFKSLWVDQAEAWYTEILLLRRELARLIEMRPAAEAWTVLLEYPLYRLRRRIDAVILSDSAVAVIEIKVGETEFTRADERQVEEYALDLRDFHERSHKAPLYPILWCTGAPHTPLAYVTGGQVAAVQLAGWSDLADVLVHLPQREDAPQIVAEAWDESPYRPVPSVIEAATHIFAGHDVRDIARADASNLAEAGKRVVKLIVEARQAGRNALIFLTGVPGSGKTLAGLQVVHDAVASGSEARGDIVYLSGNTPLVTVLREALARDEHRRTRESDNAKTLGKIRSDVRARIQHIMDFLQQYLGHNPESPPHEHVIVFDEAQRAWNEAQGLKKFDREKSEPALLLEIMSRHQDWCTCVCLIGAGQEINSGEQGIAGWGEALRKLSADQVKRWDVYGPESVIGVSPPADELSLGDLPESIGRFVETELELVVPLRTFRTPLVSEWVSNVLQGDSDGARKVSEKIEQYPIMLTRSLADAREWLKQRGLGQRRYGLVASSGARRLRADGLGVLLGANDKEKIAHWYLEAHGDIRSSFALELPANEYACQGLEIDFAAVCWGGDMLYDPTAQKWRCRALGGTEWNEVHSQQGQVYIRNSYRVLLTRAREGMIVWVPLGDAQDPTREPNALNDTARFLQECGAMLLDKRER